MAVLLVMQWDGVTPAQYDEIRRVAEMDTVAPKGLISHTAGFTETGILVADVWETSEAFNTYVAERLHPAFAAQNLAGQPNIQIVPIHATLVPEAAAAS